MISEHAIQAFAERIVAEFDPVKVVLFGSYAYGTPDNDSDVDLLVILPLEGSSLDQSVDMLKRTSPPFPVDLLARSPEDTARRYAEYDPLIRDALDRGRVLYERDRSASVDCSRAEHRAAATGRGYMSATVQEWLDEAEGDYRTAQRELRARTYPNYKSACFHGQQCAEKLMKALMIHRRVVPPRTHDLVQLSRLLAGLVHGWSWDEAELADLSRWAVAGRYPGTRAGRAEAGRALDICTRLRARLLPLVAEPF